MVIPLPRKILIALAAAYIFQAFLAFSAEAQGSQNNSTCVSHSVPTVMSPGEQKTVSVTVRNAGATTWTTSGPNYYYIAVAPGASQAFGVPYVALPSPSIPPGSAATFSFTITAPQAQGAYLLQYQMAQEGVEYFGEWCGSKQVVVWNRADSLLNSMKERGCMWSSLVTGPGDYNIRQYFDEYVAMLNRSACAYLARSIETWIEPPDFVKITGNINRIKQATGRDYIYEVMIAEAINSTAQYMGFNFSAMCSVWQPMQYNPGSCIPSLNKPEYRRYVKYITEKAIDSGIQSFLFGQVYFQDENWTARLAIPEVVAEMKAYALSKGRQIAIGAQTNDIDDASYLRNFDFISGVTAQDANGNIEEGPCHSSYKPVDNYSIYQCLALLWHDRFRVPAQSNNVLILIPLDFASDKNDDIHKFARMPWSSRRSFLYSISDFLEGRGIGFQMPFLVGMGGSWENGECHGNYPWIYSASNNCFNCTCKDEDDMNIILLNSSNPRNSHCVNYTIPAFMVPGEELDVTIVLNNTGDLAWTQPDYDLATVHNTMVWNPFVLELPSQAVLPGSQAVYSFRLRAPAIPGNYSADYRLFKRDVTAFGDFCGPASVSVNGRYKSDLNHDGKVDMPELTTFLDRWKVNSQDVTLRELIEAIGLWKKGC